jgi:hypothetical protein
MQKTKVIIYNETDNLSDLDCLDYVRQVMLEGKISGSEDKKQYCYCTYWSASKTTVIAGRTKRGADVFTVRTHAV